MPPNRSTFPLSRQSVLQPLRKKQKPEPSRFVPCPVCNRSFPSYFIHDHVHLCLDSSATGRAQLPSQRPSSEDAYRFCSSSVGEVEKNPQPQCGSLKSSPVKQDCANSLVISSPPPTDSHEIHELSSFANDSVGLRDGGAATREDGAQAPIALPEEDAVSGDPGQGLQIFQVKTCNLLVFLFPTSCFKRSYNFLFNAGLDHSIDLIFFMQFWFSPQD